MSAERTGGELIGDFLATFDIPYVFGNPGTTETTFLAAVAASKSSYMLALHESSAVGIAAGYALVTGKPAVVSLHTYPGLANGMFNMRNALMAGVPLLVVNGQQDSRFLIHNPVLGAPNVRLADDAVPASLGEVARVLAAVPRGKLAIVADYAVGASHGVGAVSRIATALGADTYAAPFHVQGTVDPLHANFRGQLPSTTREINQILSRYQTMLLIGEKVDTFTYDGSSALPGELQVVQIAPASSQLGFDYPCDIAVLGDVGATLEALATALKAGEAGTDRLVDVAALEAKYSPSGARPSDATILGLLRELDRETHIITEGSSEDAIVQDMAVRLGFRNVHFSPRGGGLGWAMPLGVGIGLATGRHAVCFVGDGGSLFSIHALWTAAKYRIPSIFVCFVNHEYRLLKDLWCRAMGTTIETTRFVGLDFSDPNLDMQAIATGLGARTEKVSNAGSPRDLLSRALAYAGPSFLIMDREP